MPSFCCCSPCVLATGDWCSGSRSSPPGTPISPAWVSGSPYWISAPRHPSKKSSQSPRDPRPPPPTPGRINLPALLMSLRKSRNLAGVYSRVLCGTSPGVLYGTKQSLLADIHRPARSAAPQVCGSKRYNCANILRPARTAGLKASLSPTGLWEHLSAILWAFPNLDTRCSLSPRRQGAGMTC